MQMLDHGAVQKPEGAVIPIHALARLEQSSENMSRTFGCKPLIVFEWVLDSEKV
jgi:hypothetical protein